MKGGNFFKGRVDPSKWRPVRPGEPGYGKRQYVRKSVTHVTPTTQRLSVAKYQTAKFGKTPKERSLLNVAGRTEEQRAAYKAKRAATAAKKREYNKTPGTNVKIKHIRKLEKMPKTKEAIEKLTPEERNQLAYTAFQDPKKHQDFLDLIYPDGIPQKRRRKKVRMTKERIMRAADSARRKAA